MADLLGVTNDFSDFCVLAGPDPVCGREGQHLIIATWEKFKGQGHSLAVPFGSWLMPPAWGGARMPHTHGPHGPLDTQAGCLVPAEWDECPGSPLGPLMSL